MISKSPGTEFTTRFSRIRPSNASDTFQKVAEELDGWALVAIDFCSTKLDFFPPITARDSTLKLLVSETDRPCLIFISLPSRYCESAAKKISKWHCPLCSCPISVFENGYQSRRAHLPTSPSPADRLVSFLTAPSLCEELISVFE
jgi:hypothetical protein